MLLDVEVGGRLRAEVVPERGPELGLVLVAAAAVALLLPLLERRGGVTEVADALLDRGAERRLDLALLHEQLLRAGARLAGRLEVGAQLVELLLLFGRERPLLLARVLVELKHLGVKTLLLLRELAQLVTPHGATSYA
jgi:hypothetical protein